MSTPSKLDTVIKTGRDMVVFPTIASLRKEAVTAADWIEGAVWLAVIVGWFYLGMALFDPTPATTPIVIGYGLVTLLVAVWTMKRQRARGIRRWF